jgi:hypothetical protein
MAGMILAGSGASAVTHNDKSLVWAIDKLKRAPLKSAIEAQRRLIA